MDSRERFLRALRHDQPDRVPVHDGIWAETVRRWQKEWLPVEIPMFEQYRRVIELVKEYGS